MRSARPVAFALAVLTTLATAARAEDPPPTKAKHENKAEHDLCS